MLMNNTGIRAPQPPSPSFPEIGKFLVAFRASTIILTAIQEGEPIQTATFHSGKDEGASIQWITARQARGCNIYFLVGEAIRPLTKKAKKTDIARAHWAWVDIDASDDLDWRDDEAVKAELSAINERLNEFPLPPSLTVFSGGGFQAFWRLAAPFELDNDPIRIGEFEAVNRGLAKALGADHCHNVDRIMRLSGTVNFPNAKKRSKGRQPMLARLAQHNAGADYAFDDLKSIAVKATQESPAPNKHNDLIKKLNEKIKSRPKSTEEWANEVLDKHINAKQGITRSELFAAIAYEAFNKSYSPASLIDLFDGKPIAARYDSRKSLVDEITRLHKKWKSDDKSKSVDDIVNELNQEYAVVLDRGGKLAILHETLDADGYPVNKFMRLADFHVALQAKKIFIEKDDRTTVVTHAQAFLNSEGRRQYKGVTFEPSKERNTNGYLNQWAGFGCEARAGDWSLMLQHIIDVIADGVEEHAMYILRYIAWAVQNPEKPAEVAVILRGEEGTGKGILLRSIKELFGRHGRQITNVKHLTGNFNKHLETCCLLYADEAFWAGDKAAEKSLMGMITEPTIAIEAKGLDVIESKNHLKIVIASNEKWVVPAGQDARRYAVFNVSNAHKRDRKYFSAIDEQMKNGGSEGMLFSLLNMNLKGWHPRNDIPQTKALAEQKMQSLGAEESFVYKLLVDGRLSRHGGIKIGAAPNSFIGSQELLDSFKEHAGNSKAFINYKTLPPVLREWGCEPKKLPTKNGWIFPPLDEMRRRWIEKYGHSEWDKDSDDGWGGCQ